MPMYDLQCIRCGEVTERVLGYDDRDKRIKHGFRRAETKAEHVGDPSITGEFHAPCGGYFKRIPSAVSLGKPAFQMAGIASDGTKIPGTFGKGYRTDATKRRKRLAKKR